ncbi:hypothetical protein KY492_26010 [Brevibacterium sp. PAMC21349]|nr:hypothetical protein KY492_26010 [Brevibacterium sp. PAMC21349]
MTNIDTLIGKIKNILDNKSPNDIELEELGILSFEIFNEYNYRPYFTSIEANSLIGRRGGDQFTAEQINPLFFRNPERVKFLLEYIKIKPLLDMLKKSSYSLPQERKEDFPNFIDSLFSRYTGELNTISSDFFLKEEMDAVTDLCKMIVESLNHYYAGYPNLSYQSIDKGMVIVKKYADEFIGSPRSHDTYRMRVGNNHTFSKTEMFHIPFELRGLVSTQRYSIPGLPCLYLGSSAYICWEEMNKPDLNVIQTSMFAIKPDSNMKFLDLGYPPDIVSEGFEEMLSKAYGSDNWSNLINSIKGYVVIWPLIAACSIKVTNKNDAFKPEYIIPQLLLQWVRITKNYDGIIYFSVASKLLTRSNFHLYLNYAIPVKTKGLNGHCETLKESFWVTDAVPWQVFKLYKDSGLGFIIDTKQAVEFEMIPKTKILYHKTDFAKLESFLKTQRPISIT